MASFNIKCAGCETGSELSWEKRRDSVKNTILGQTPDVIGLQEASQASLKGDTLNQYDDLVRLLGDPYRVANAYRYNCATSTSTRSCSKVNSSASESARIIYNAEKLMLLETGSLELDHASTKDNERYLAWAKLRQISTGEGNHLRHHAPSAQPPWHQRHLQQHILCPSPGAGSPDHGRAEAGQQRWAGGDPHR